MWELVPEILWSVVIALLVTPNIRQLLQRIHQAEGLQTTFYTKKGQICYYDFMQASERVYIVGNTLKPLPIDSPDSGVELKKKSHRKIFFYHGEK